MLTSGAQIEVITAAAGTGKSFIVGAIADTWTTPPSTPSGSDDPEVGEPPARRVFGLAPYQNAAEVLAGEGLNAKNVRAWLTTQNRLDRVRPGGPTGGPGGDDENWRLRRDDLVVLDEAGTAETGDLVAVHQRCAAVGAKLLLVGDPRQLSAIGPGGALVDIGEHGISYQLSEVRRFSNEWEGPVSLRLRDGDPAALAEYAKHGRIIDGGTAEQAETAASRAWLADTLSGHESLLMVGSNAAAARVSAQLRADLVRLGRVDEDGVPLGEGTDLPDWRGTVAGVGDLVQARALAWHLRGFEGNTAAPITRKTYRVLATRVDGGLTVAPIIDRARPADQAVLAAASIADGVPPPEQAAITGAVAPQVADDVERNGWGEQLGPMMQLPGSYVREHISLGYASTKDAAQGRTVDTGHTVNSAGCDLAGFYVPFTRGRHANTAYVITRHLAPDADTGETFDAQARRPEDVLADVLALEHVERTALAEQSHAEATAASVMTQIDRMADLIREANAGRLAGSLDQLAARGHLTDHDRARLAADDAFGSLERLLRTAELAGHDPENVLTAAVTARGFDTATSPAQVLHHRISTRLTGQLTPRLHAGVVDLIPRHLREPDGVVPVDARAAQHGARLQLLAEAADSRRHELGTLTAEEASAWAVDALGPVPDDADVIGRQEWEHRAGWAAAYRELVGHADDADPLGVAPGPGRVEHRMVFRAAHEALALAEAGDEEAGMTDGRLRNRVRAYDRERTWAPRWVADDLAAAHERQARSDADATVWNARAAAPGTVPGDAEQLRTDAVRARAEAEQLAEQIVELEAADQAWAEWYAHTAVTRDLAERSTIELRTRGIDLDNPPDRTTAPDWLAAHRAAQDEHDSHATITEADVHDADDRVDEAVAPQTADPAVSDEPGRPDQHAETEVADLRDIATPDATETADPAQRRRVLTGDETTQAVTRAQTALSEIAARRAADAERAVAEGARADAEAELRDQLTRWDGVGSDTTVDVLDAAGAHVADQPVDDGAALER